MRRILLPALALFALACGPEPLPVAPPPPAPPAPRALAFEDDPAAPSRIASDVTHLASPDLAGRGTGEPGGELAARFVLQRFRDLGLSPAGDRGDYLQAFQARVGAKVVKSDLQVSTGNKKIGNHPAMAAVGSASGSVSARAVFVGYGITSEAGGWDDYLGESVDGKIAILLDGLPTRAMIPAKPGEKAKTPTSLGDFGAVRYKLRNAREHKAAGVIIVTDGDTLPKPPEDAGSMGIPAVVIGESQAKALFPTLKLHREKPSKLARPVDLPKGVEVSIAVDIQPVEATSWNVIGSLPGRAGSPTKDEIVIVGAHYDHLGHGNAYSRAPDIHAVHPGADDNASGAALMLDVARRFAALPEKPARTMLFMAFGAEEIGAVGSRHFTKHPTIALDRVVAMLNADMVGRLREDRLVVDGVATSPGWKPLVERAADGLGLSIALGGEGFGASDHASFTAVRVPVAFFFTGVHEDYHMPSDTADKINTRGEARIATLVARLALAVSEAPERLPFVDPPTDPHKGGRGGFKVSLGTIPDYAYTGKGLRLDGVRADAPAARAGLQRGDVIVKVGPHEIGNIHDFMFSLGELSPGREVAIEVERDGKRLTLRAIPAPGK